MHLSSGKISPILAYYCEMIVPELPAPEGLSPFDHEQTCREICERIYQETPLKITASEAWIALQAIRAGIEVRAVKGFERAVASFLEEALSDLVAGRTYDPHNWGDAMARLDYAIRYLVDYEEDTVPPAVINALKRARWDFNVIWPDTKP